MTIFITQGRYTREAIGEMINKAVGVNGVSS